MLQTIHESNDYPFLYTALVGDANLKAYDRLTLDFNFAGYPSCFFDAGYRLFIGGTPTESYFRNKIEEAGLRDVTPLDMLVKLEWVSSSDIQISIAVGNGTEANTAPSTPIEATGISNGEVGINYSFETQSYDPENNTLWYQFDWGDGNLSSWFGPVPSGEKYNASHSWDSNGSYTVSSRCKDIWDDTSGWSSPHNVIIGCCMGIRGNIDGDQLDQIDIADLVYFVTYSFGGGPEPSCIEEADVDASTALDIADIVYLVSYMFSAGPAPLSCG